MLKKAAKVLLIICVLLLNGCQTSTNQQNNGDSNNEVQESSVKESEETKTKTTIKLQFDNREIVVELDDNSATRDLVSRLPLDVQFEDFNGTEKICYLDEDLDTSDVSTSCLPVQGTLAYYIPWGNICFFYQDFQESNNLAPLGKVVEGLEYLEELDQGSSVQISVEQ